MPSSTRQWERNTDGLRSHAQKKAEATQQQAESALTRLIKEQRPITFTSVAETAGISTAWLYGNEAIKQRIMHLRAELSPRTPMKMPPREQASSASKDAMIAALQKRVREQAEEIKELRKQLEVAYQHLY
jgi:predicted RNase H-like nuclease (RuvC/YqgF family)